MSLVLEFLDFTLEIDFTLVGILFAGWLSYFFILMTSVIISRGKAYTIFVFMGLSIAASQVALMFHRTFNLGRNWWEVSDTMMFIQYLITMVVMGIIGIVVLSKQNL